MTNEKDDLGLVIESKLLTLTDHKGNLLSVP